VSGRVLSWLLMALLAAALVGQTQLSRRRVDADRVLHQVEVVSVHMAGAGQRALPIFWANVKLLQRAEEEAPSDSRLLLAEGSQYLLLGRPEEAAATYQRALAVEARPEIYLNLGCA
jgi:Flp pilus assembly protein TadD